MNEKETSLETLVMVFRQALLLMVDAIEAYFNMPKTGDLRKQLKQTAYRFHAHKLGVTVSSLSSNEKRKAMFDATRRQAVDRTPKII